MKNQANRKLISNTVFLYLMTTSIQILNLLTVPYLSRVLGPTEYGQIGLALGYMAYVQIILDFGFTLYATKKISENKTDKCKIEYIITAVTFIKVILAVCLGVVFLLFLYINVFDVTLMTILQVYLLGYLITALLPDFYYRGMENMKSIALRTLIVRVLFPLISARNYMLFCSIGRIPERNCLCLFACTLLNLPHMIQKILMRCNSMTHELNQEQFFRI